MVNEERALVPVNDKKPVRKYYGQTYYEVNKALGIIKEPVLKMESPPKLPKKGFRNKRLKWIRHYIGAFLPNTVERLYELMKPNVQLITFRSDIESLINKGWLNKSLILKPLMENRRMRAEKIINYLRSGESISSWNLYNKVNSGVDFKTFKRDLKFLSDQGRIILRIASLGRHGRKLIIRKR